MGENKVLLQQLEDSKAVLAGSQQQLTEVNATLATQTVCI